jgi:hypothetical protein
MIQPIAIAALLLAQAGTPAKPPCVPRDGIRDAAMVLAPHLVEAVADKCKAHLPATSFLASGSAGLVTRMKAASAGRANSAAAAVRAVAGDKLPDIKDSEALMTMGAAFAGLAVTESLKPEMCPEMSNLVEAMAPLPSENLGRAILSVLVLAKVGDKGNGPTICPNG